MFSFGGPLTLVFYKPKPVKMIYSLLLCDEDAIIKEGTGKLKMITYYNQPKGGLDNLGQICSLISCNMKNRWPMGLLYGMINNACIHADII